LKLKKQVKIIMAENTFPKILVHHPGKQHSYQVVKAFQQTSLLYKFITGIYFQETQFPYNLVNLFPLDIKNKFLRQLKKRRKDELSDDSIISIPYFELISKILGNIKPIYDLSNGRSSYYLNDLLSDFFVSEYIKGCAEKIDMVYGFYGSSLRTILTAKKKGIRTILDVPIVVNAYEIIAIENIKLGVYSKPKVEKRRLLELENADIIIAPSIAVADSIQKCGISKDNIRVIPFGVDTNVFHPVKKEQENKNTKFIAIFVGQFHMRKGVHYLLEAWKELDLPDSELIIVGPATNQRFVEQMRIKYKEYYVEKGNVPNYELIDLYSQADIFIFPSLAEGSALVTYEALACGLPCIVTEEAGSVVRDKIDGYIIPSRDIDTLKDRILKLYKDKDLRRQMSVAARKRAEEYTWKRYQENLFSLVMEIYND